MGYSPIIDSAPNCIQQNAPAASEDDLADFIVNGPYEPCREAGGGIMTFGPGSTYGEEGASAETAYYVLTWLGIVFMLVVLISWMIWENRRLIAHAARITASRVELFGTHTGAETYEIPPSQPGTNPDAS
jgi:hypothetical protein